MAASRRGEAANSRLHFQLWHRPPTLGNRAGSSLPESPTQSMDTGLDCRPSREPITPVVIGGVDPMTPYASTWGRESIVSRLRRESRSQREASLSRHQLLRTRSAELLAFSPSSTATGSEYTDWGYNRQARNTMAQLYEGATPQVFEGTVAQSQGLSTTLPLTRQNVQPHRESSPSFAAAMCTVAETPAGQWAVSPVMQQILQYASGSANLVTPSGIPTSTTELSVRLPPTCPSSQLASELTSTFEMPVEGAAEALSTTPSSVRGTVPKSVSPGMSPPLRVPPAVNVTNSFSTGVTSAATAECNSAAQSAAALSPRSAADCEERTNNGAGFGQSLAAECNSVPSGIGGSPLGGGTTTPSPRGSEPSPVPAVEDFISASAPGNTWDIGLTDAPLSDISRAATDPLRTLPEIHCDTGARQAVPLHVRAAGVPLPPDSEADSDGDGSAAGERPPAAAPALPAPGSDAAGGSSDVLGLSPSRLLVAMMGTATTSDGVGSRSTPPSASASAPSADVAPTRTASEPRTQSSLAGSPPGVTDWTPVQQQHAVGDRLSASSDRDSDGTQPRDEAVDRSWADLAEVAVSAAAELAALTPEPPQDGRAPASCDSAVISTPVCGMQPAAEIELPPRVPVGGNGGELTPRSDDAPRSTFSRGSAPGQLTPRSDEGRRRTFSPSGYRRGLDESSSDSSHETMPATEAGTDDTQPSSALDPAHTGRVTLHFPVAAGSLAATCSTRTCSSPRGTDANAAMTVSVSSSLQRSCLANRSPLTPGYSTGTGRRVTFGGFVTSSRLEGEEEGSDVAEAGTPGVLSPAQSPGSAVCSPSALEAGTAAGAERRGPAGSTPVPDFQRMEEADEPSAEPLPASWACIETEGVLGSAAESTPDGAVPPAEAQPQPGWRPPPPPELPEMSALTRACLERVPAALHLAVVAAYCPGVGPPQRGWGAATAGELTLAARGSLPGLCRAAAAAGLLACRAAADAADVEAAAAAGLPAAPTPPSPSGVVLSSEDDMDVPVGPPGLGLQPPRRTLPVSPGSGRSAERSRSTFGPPQEPGKLPHVAPERQGHYEAWEREVAERAALRQAIAAEARPWTPATAGSIGVVTGRELRTPTPLPRTLGERSASPRTRSSPVIPRPPPPQPPRRHDPRHSRVRARLRSSQLQQRCSPGLPRPSKPKRASAGGALASHQRQILQEALRHSRAVWSLPLTQPARPKMGHAQAWH
eukprot:TRINITY_DN3548_c0_g1_i5.p1 TRINITY_DN3548_c0_g1~~TRINITY_DN3548_c0_g1_i5.p1  ORF type:complete len:1244 (+),score=190.63 TRINITY_DN3548_c0_g1_i5:88-3732(+)